MAQSADSGADPDARYGLPLIRARAILVEAALWKAALIASNARASLAWSDEIPGSPWRYEVFVPPVQPTAERWAQWPSQEANPFYRAEAARQNAFYDVSLALGRRLLAGELQGYGRLGNMVGPMTAIPAAAWRVLKVAYEPGFANWHLGHVAGPGMEFWSVRVHDTIGLPLQAAAIAYGPSEAAAIVQQAEAFGIAQSVPPAKPGTLDARMRESGNRLKDSPRPSKTETDKALRDLKSILVQMLQNGALIATGRDGRGAVQRIPAEHWRSGQADFAASALTIGRTQIGAVCVRMPPPLPEADPESPAPMERDAAPAAGPLERPLVRLSKEEMEGVLAAFFLPRVRHWPEGEPSAERDEADARAWATQQGYDARAITQAMIRKLHRKYWGTAVSKTGPRRRRQPD